jgi:hypothetical protein
MTDSLDIYIENMVAAGIRPCGHDGGVPSPDLPVCAKTQTGSFSGGKAAPNPRACEFPTRDLRLAEGIAWPVMQVHGRECPGAVWLTTHTNAHDFPLRLAFTPEMAREAGRILLALADKAAAGLAQIGDTHDLHSLKRPKNTEPAHYAQDGAAVSTGIGGVK